MTAPHVARSVGDLIKEICPITKFSSPKNLSQFGMYPREKLSLYNDDERQICSKNAFQLKHLSAKTESDQRVMDDNLENSSLKYGTFIVKCGLCPASQRK